MSTGLRFNYLDFRRVFYHYCSVLLNYGDAGCLCPLEGIDGDTFFYKGKRYRIQQYNAPEIGEPGARQATRDLQRKIDSGNYVWKPVAKDIYGRTVVKERKKR